MGDFEKEVEKIVLDRFGSIAEFARITNLNEQTLHSLFSQGSFSRARSATVGPIANALEVDQAWLAKGQLVDNSTRFKGFAEVPLFSSITAGQPLGPTATDERFPIPIELAERYPNAFLLRIPDTSMNRILPDGCYALVDPCTDIEHQGQPYALTIGASNATVKRVRSLWNGLELSPDSTDPTYRTRICDFGDQDVEDVTVIGRVVWYCLPLNWRFW